MSERCPYDGGFIGDAGCTHPNHRHSDLVRGIVSGEPKMISEAVFNIIPKRSLKGRARGSGKRFAATRRKQTAAPSEIIANRRVVAQGGASA